MKENKQLLIGAIIISISIIIGFAWIGNLISKINKDINSNNLSSIATSKTLATSKALMSAKETAEYLNMPLKKFYSLIAYEEGQANYGYFDTYEFIPFVKIDGVKFYNKAQVDKWIEYTSLKGIGVNTTAK